MEFDRKPTETEKLAAATLAAALISTGATAGHPIDGAKAMADYEEMLKRLVWLHSSIDEATT